MAAEPYALRPFQFTTQRLLRWTWGTLSLAMLLATAVGCKNSPTQFTSPFLADRVPPPGSRIPTTGTAQPYYQGGAVSPLPVTNPTAAPATMQAFPQTTQPLGALQPSNDITPLPADGGFVATASPSGEEVAVAIPSDEGTMRFAMAAPTQPVATPATPSTTPSFTNVAMQPAATAPPTTATALHQTNPSAVTVPAINNWPPATGNVAPLEANGSLSANTAELGNASGLFRDPTPPALYDAQPSTAPRVRLPNSDQRVREEVVPGTINTTNYQVGYAGGGSSTTMVIPPSGVMPASYQSAPQQTPASQDGFHARGSSTIESQQTDVPVMYVTPG